MSRTSQSERSGGVDRNECRRLGAIFGSDGVGGDAIDVVDGQFVDLIVARLESESVVNVLSMLSGLARMRLG